MYGGELWSDVDVLKENCMKETILRQFCTDIKRKQYTYCERGRIIGSDQCRGCYRFVDKVIENEKKDGRYTMKSLGLVECVKE